MPQLAGDHVQVLVHGYELTADSNRISIPDTRDLYDISSFGDATHKFIPGRRSITLEHAGYMEAAVAHSHPVLKGLAVSGVVSALLGQNAAPAVGDPVYSLAIRQGKYSVLPEVGKYVPFTATFANRGELGGWGVALAVPVTFTNTANGTAVDNGGATTKGGVAFLHLLTAAATDRYTIKVQASPSETFSSEVTTWTFSLNASAIGSEFITLTGPIAQYTRWTAERSGSAGDTVKIAVSLVRF